MSKNTSKLSAFIGGCSDAGANKKGASNGPTYLKQKFSDIYPKWVDMIKTPHQNPTDEIKQIVTRIRAETTKQLNKSKFPVLVGGDHSLAMGSIAGIFDFYEKTDTPIYVLWIDAHADIHTYSTSSTKNLHGMPLSMLLNIDQSGKILKQRQYLKKENVLMIGLRSVDAPERELLKNNGIKNFNDRYTGFVTPLKEWLLKLPSNAHLHISLDLDVLDPLEMPAVSTPEAGGLSYEELKDIMGMVKPLTQFKSLDLMEYNPFYDKKDKALDSLKDLIRYLDLV